MCGICGMVGMEDRNLLLKMRDILRHRGPDDSGLYLDTNVGLGCQQLRITDLNEHQPIHNEDESVWVMFDGEVYNYIELKQDLEKKGHEFYTNSDTEAIVHLYEDIGYLAVEKLRGEFAIAIWNANEESLLLARDRLGIKPLYYTIINRDLLFASEIKSILQCGEMARNININSVLSFLAYSCILGSESILLGIWKVPPASIMIYKKGEIETRKYWDLNVFTPLEKPIGWYEKNLREILESSVKTRLNTGMPLGMYLSGGLDSTSVLYLMKRFLHNESIHTFSVGYEEKKVDEKEQARSVAEHFGTEHHEFVLEPDVAKLLPKVIWHLDEPIGDPTAIPLYLLSEVAKKYTSVVLTGDGGDELFGGYIKYQVLFVDECYGRKLPSFIKSKGSCFLTKIVPKLGLRPGVCAEIEKSLNYFSSKENTEPWKRYLQWSVFDDYAIKEFCDDRFLKQTKGLKPVKDMAQPFFKTDSSFLDQVSVFDIHRLSEDRLMLADRMAMANAVEVRAPLLDHRVAEFSRSIPYHMKFKRRTDKYIFRKAMSNLLPKNVLKRRKRPFVAPARLWLENLKEVVPQILCPDTIRKRGYFKYDFIRHLLMEYDRNDFPSANKIWNLLILELWQRIFFDKNSSEPPSGDIL